VVPVEKAYSFDSVGDARTLAELFDGRCYRCGVSKLRSIMPALPVRDLDAAIDFYRDKLGFAVRHREAGGGAIVVRDAIELHLTPLNDESWKVRPDFIDRPVKSGAESFLPGTASLRIQVDDVRELYAECASKGILHPKGSLREESWGEVGFGILDFDCNLITFFQRGAGGNPQ
jgi:catechol 2,3-dioxygenase-like lactoylglutathione lyase family enzyme